MGRRIKKHLTITLSQAGFARLERMAESRGTNRSNMVELLIYGPEKTSPKPREVVPREEDLSEKLDRTLVEIDETLKNYKQRS